MGCTSLFIYFIILQQSITISDNVSTILRQSKDYSIVTSYSSLSEVSIQFSFGQVDVSVLHGLCVIFFSQKIFHCCHSA